MVDLWNVVAAERGAMAEDLAGLNPAQWKTRSLCDDWSVRRVTAHMTATANLTQYADPFVGTDDSSAPNPVPGGAGGSTYPGAVVPFGGVQFSPDTPTASPSGYRSSDTSVEDFSRRSPPAFRARTGSIQAS